MLRLKDPSIKKKFTTTYCPVSTTQEWARSDICTEYCDNGFCFDLGYFGHFYGTKFVRGGYQLERLLLEVEDWITAGQVSVGAGAEARGDRIRGNGRKWLNFSLI